MFHAEAHSLQQQARLAITLSWVAGYTNILTLLVCGQATSHVSGTASQLGFDVAAGKWTTGAYMLALLVTFFFGAALSGILMEGARKRQWESIYVLPMAVEGVLLAIFAIFVEWHVDGTIHGNASKLWLTLIPSAAMGLQNATITRISSGVVRTTHVTGVLTDFGVESALWVMSKLGKSPPATTGGTPITAYRLALLSSVLGSFILGAGLGALAFEHITRWAMVPAVAFVIWIIVQDLITPIAEIQHHRDAGGSLHNALPSDIAIFHLKGRKGRFGGRARFPNLQLWADRLPPHIRGVVLDIEDSHELTRDEAMAIRILAHRLDSHGKCLIVAGVSGERYELLRSCGALDVVDPLNLCSDLELAGARAVSLMHESLFRAAPRPV